MEPLAIRSPFPGARAFLVASTPSTQEEAKALAAAGFPPGSLVAAEEQSSGRGRFPERRWESEAGKSLLFTIFLGPEATALPGLPIRVGLALRDSVSELAARAGVPFACPPLLKWPNDLMIGDRKAAGILCEAGSAGVFAGVGLNFSQASFPPGLEGRATSLAMELGRELGRWELLELFLERLAELLADEAWREAAAARLWRLGERVYFLPGLASRGMAGPGLPAGGGRGEPILGVLEGLDGAGSLLIRAEGEPAPSAYPAGELTAEPTAYRVVG
jgi:BirA family transcriptional regulator, biotin operon repressor / biotin---[acetyl-CoA-carboxylase] ligase